MKNRIISLTLVLVLTVLTVAGCTSKQPGSVNTAIKQKSKPQLVVATNPIILLNGETGAIAFNDVKNAISNDRKSASLTSLSDNTNWLWNYKTGDAWKKRGTYGLEKWRNGSEYSADNISAYSFTDDGTISIMPYTTKAVKLTTYQDEEPPQAGVLLAVSGCEEESLCYQIEENGSFAIPEGKITAIKSVGGVNTGFLADDAASRSAVVKFIINTRVIWSGEFKNSVAGDGTAATELSYPDISDIDVEAGDKFFISIKLDAQLSAEEQAPSPDRDNKNDNDGDNKPSDSNNSDEREVNISLIDGYDSRFKIVYPKNSTVTQKQIFTKLRKQMVDVFEADVALNDDTKAETEYEILIGLTDRAESQRAYDDLINYRANNASDFIIRMDGKKLVIIANTDFALQSAADCFMKNYCKSDKDSISSKLNYEYRPRLKNIVIGNTNIASFTIRTEKYPSVMTVRAAQKLAEYVVEKTGYNLKIEKDTSVTQNEILIGLTTRSGISANTFKSGSLDNLSGKDGTVLGNDDYKIYLKGTKFFVEAGSDYATNSAVLKLISHLEKKASYAANQVLSGSYKKGEYTLLGDYAYTWGDEFISSTSSSINKKNWKVMEKGYTESAGSWYKKTDPYYLASKASLEDNDPNNDFGGPWINLDNSVYVQEGTIKNLASNAVIKNNMLVQTSKKDVNGYSGSILCTDGRMEFRYGILETRIKAATANGNASSFWTRTKDGTGLVNEIDIFESFGEDKLKPNLHTWAEEHTNHGEMITLRNICYPKKNEHFYDTFHHIALEWTPDFINLYLDGEIYLSQDITSDTWNAFRETTYVIFTNSAPTQTYSNAGNPGNWLAGGNINPNAAARIFDTNGDGVVNVNDFYEEQYVDYIRLYQLDSRLYSLKAKK